MVPVLLMVLVCLADMEMKAMADLVAMKVQAVTVVVTENQVADKAAMIISADQIPVIPTATTGTGIMNGNQVTD
jgi:hypothetical protein